MARRRHAAEVEYRGVDGMRPTPQPRPNRPSGRAADPLCGRIGRQQLRMLRLERPELGHQRVVDLVTDIGIVEHVVPVVVVLDRSPQHTGLAGLRISPKAISSIPRVRR